MLDSRYEDPTVLVGDILCLFYLKAGGFEQLGILRFGFYVVRARGDCQLIVVCAEVGGDMDDLKSEPSILSEDSAAGSQHGELVGQSTEHVRMRDGIESFGAERQPTP